MSDNASNINDYDNTSAKVRQQRKKINIILSLVSMMVAGLIYFYLAPSYIKSNVTSGLSPQFFPKLWAFVIFLAALIQLVVILLKPESIESDGDLEDWPAERRKRGLAVMSFIIFYVFVLIELLGFFIATPLVLAGSFLLLGERSILKIILVSLIFTISVYMLFEIGLDIYLPRGILW
ncbi:MAG: tripartite tricarboxylate transporter TctB family protein [Clostridiaceae bacterium]|nr:tripartite tricarboxylate transporter TctB family protein [Clostridiaceae bacterium]